MRWKTAVGTSLVVVAAIWAAYCRNPGPSGPAPEVPRPPVPSAGREPASEEALGSKDPDPARASCSIGGVVLRDGGPVAARVEACLLRAGPPDPGSSESWEAWEASPSLYEGCDTAIRGATEAGADGRWSMGGLPSGQWAFRATSSDGARGIAERTLRTEAPPDLEILLRPGDCTLRGRALLPGGEPFRGLVTVEEDSRHVSLPVEAGPDGGFRFEALPRACVRLGACVRGRRVVPGPVVLLPCDEEVPFVVGAGFVELTGRVLESAGDWGVAGARVSVGGIDVDDWTVADVEGRYRLAVPEGGWLHLRAEAPGYLRAEEEGGKMAVAGARPVDLRLSRPGTLSGRVTIHGTGAPALGAIVAAEGQGFPFPREGRRAVAGPDGRYELRVLAPRPTVVLVAGGGFLSKSLAGTEPWDPRADTVDLPEGGAATLDMEAVAAPRVRGRVVDDEGSGIAGVEVSACSEDGTARESAPAFAVAMETFTTAEDGSFIGPTPLPGVTYRFEATRDGETCAVSSLPPVAAGWEAEVVLRVAPQCPVLVRVLDEETEVPLPGIEVNAMAEYLPGSGAYRGLGETWKSGEDGTVSVGPVPQVRLRLHCSAEGDRWPRDGHEVAVDLPVADPVVLYARVRPVARKLSIEGRVLHSDGSPAAEASLRCTPESERDGFGREGTTDFRGRFRLEDLPPGPVAICVWPKGVVTAVEAVAEAGDEDAVLRVAGSAPAGRAAGPTLRFRVLDPEGRPASRGEATVTFHGAHEDSDLTGRSQECGLVQGRSSVAFPAGTTSAWLQVRGARGAEPEDRPLADAVFGPLGADGGEFDAVLEYGRVVGGRVVDPRGRGVARASVHLYPVRPDDPVPGRVGLPSGEAETDSAGAFRFEGAGDLDYEIHAYGGKDLFDSVKTTARGGDEDVTVVMRQAAEAMVTVMDMEGRAVEGAFVYLETPGLHFGDREFPVANAAGRVRLLRLDPDGGSNLIVRPPPERKDLYEIRIEDWTPADTTVRLPRAQALVVSVLDGKGRPVPSVSVIARFGDHASDPNDCASGNTGADGRVTLEGIPEGPVEVEARLEVVYRREGDAATVRLESDCRETTLTLDTGEAIRVRVPGIRPRSRVHLQVGAPGQPEPICGVHCGPEETRIRGLQAGVAYDLFAEEFPGNNFMMDLQAVRRSALVRGVRPGENAVEIPLAPGKEISGTVRLPAGWYLSDAGVLVGDAILIGPDTSDYKLGSFHIGGVPEGRWTIRARIRTDEGEEREVDAEADAGGTVEIDAR